MITIALNWEFVCTTYLQIKYNMCLMLTKPITILIAIIGLSVLNLLYLTFYLLCVFKKNQNTKLQQPLKIYTSSSFPDLPPEYETKRLIKFLLKEKDINREKLKQKFKYKDNTIILYIQQLLDEKFIKLCETSRTDMQYLFNLMSHDPFYCIDKKGRKYANNHNLD